MEKTLFGFVMKKKVHWLCPHAVFLHCFYFFLHVITGSSARLLFDAKRASIYPLTSVPCRDRHLSGRGDVGGKDLTEFYD